MSGIIFFNNQKGHKYYFEKEIHAKTDSHLTLTCSE